MKAESLFAAVAMTALMLVPVAAQAAGDSGPAGPSTAVKFEEIPGTDLKRVILTERAAERIGVEIGTIGEQQIIRKQMVGGRVITPVQGEPEQVAAGGGSFGGFVQQVAVTKEEEGKPGATEPSAPPTGDAWVLVTLSPDEWQRTRQDLPARILPLDTRDGAALVAQPAALEPTEDPKRTMLTAYYVIQGEDHGLTLNQRVRVELQLEGTEEPRMIAPYAAVYYDGKGQPWVYANPEPLVYERMPITIERIVGDVAVLTDGPPIGTEIVTVGAALLYGAEVIFHR